MRLGECNTSKWPAVLHEGRTLKTIAMSFVSLNARTMYRVLLFCIINFKSCNSQYILSSLKYVFCEYKFHETNNFICNWKFYSRRRISGDKNIFCGPNRAVGGAGPGPRR